jgi:O-antigen/teichoic acid export membrane protein
MLPATAQKPPPTLDHKLHALFFRQSVWLMVANIGGGIMTFGVHFLAKAVNESQYAAFVTLLMVVACLPTIPLQMVFAHQTALTLATGRERQLANMIRRAWLWTFVAWLLGAAAVYVFQKKIVAGWHLPGATGLWVTLFMLLFSLWMPMFSGVLQGRQDFFWFGWATILGCIGRFGGAVFLVLALKMGAAGMMAGAVAGVALTAVIAIWRTRDLWLLPGEQFDGWSLLKEVMPLILGFGACQFMFTSDTMFAKAFFSNDQMAQYGAAGTLSRALLWLVMPLAAVMFPKLVHANVKAEKSNLFAIVVLGTAVLTIVGGLGLWLMGPLAIKIVYKSAYLGAAKLIPWYAGAMVPLAMANVMVNDLLARARFGVVPWMVLLAVVYGFTLPWALNHFPGRLEVVLQTLAIFNTLLLAVCALFTWIRVKR